MVMFREDEERLRAAERTAEPRWKKRLRLGVKIALVFAVLFGLSLFVLGSLGGRGPALRQGIEQYLTAVTQQITTVGTLNYMAFFPTVLVDAQDLRFFRPLPGEADEKGRIEVIQGPETGRVEQMFFATSFWHVFSGQPVLRGLELRGIDIRPGVLDAEAVRIDSLAIRAFDGRGEDRPELVGTGRYKGKAFTARVELSPKTGAKFVDFKLARPASFVLEIGEDRMTGLVHMTFGKGLEFEIAQGRIGGADFTGRVSLVRKGRGFRIGGDLKLAGNPVRVDVQTRAGSDGLLEAGLTFSALALEDRDAVGDALKAYIAFLPFVPGAGDGEEGARPRGTMTLAIEQMTLDGRDIGAIHADLAVLDGGTLLAGPVTGTLEGAMLAGDVRLHRPTDVKADFLRSLDGRAAFAATRAQTQSPGFAGISSVAAGAGADGGDCAAGFLTFDKGRLTRAVPAAGSDEAAELAAMLKTARSKGLRHDCAVPAGDGGAAP